MTELAARLACPRCDRTPLEIRDVALHCRACKVDFPLLGGIPSLFAEPKAALGEWRGRLHFALAQIGDELESLNRELAGTELLAMTRQRVARYRDALETHLKSLQDLLEPLEVASLSGSYQTYLALRTRLPVDQGLNTYYANIHRDWSWGEEENRASLEQIESVLQDRADLGNVLVLGAGGGRLAYDIHQQLDCVSTVAMDFNPLLVLVAATVTSGTALELYEFPIAPFGREDDAVLRELAAPEPVRDGFHLLLGDALRPPFPPRSFDTVVTPWLIDIISEDLPALAGRINHLLADNGRWLNFGSLAFAGPARARRYSTDETAAIIAAAGFDDPFISEATIPYMCSPASRHGRRERVLSFSATKQKNAPKPARYRALPEWIVTGKEPVPLSQSFRTQAMSTQIYAFIMSLIDGKRTISDMAHILEQQKLMTREEAEPAIRSFLTKMYDDSQKQSGM
jgi:uncharacterized protein YbaR (Trm112 family)